MPDPAPVWPPWGSRTRVQSGACSIGPDAQREQPSFAAPASCPNPYGLGAATTPRRQRFASRRGSLPERPRAPHPRPCTARLSHPPAEMAVTPLSALTATGVLLQGVFTQASGPVAPLPSSPNPFEPQAMAVPLLSRARLWYPPAEMAVTLLSPLTATGTSLL